MIYTTIEDILTNLKTIWGIYDAAAKDLNKIIEGPESKPEAVRHLKQLLNRIEMVKERHVLHVESAIEELELVIDEWNAEHIDLKQFIMDDYQNRIVPKFNRDDHEPDWGTFWGAKI